MNEQYIRICECHWNNRKHKFEMRTNVVSKTTISETVIMEAQRNKLRRKSHATEFKLTVMTWFHDNGKNVHQTSQHFNLDRKQVCNWVKAEEKIRKQKLNAKAPGRGQKACFPEAGKQLHDEFLKTRILKAKQWKDVGFRHEQGNWLQKNSSFPIDGSMDFVIVIAFHLGERLTPRKNSWQN